MRWLLAILFIPSCLVGCCPVEPLRLEGGSPECVDVYDPNTDILWAFWREEGIWHKKAYPHWNYHHERWIHEDDR